MSYCPGCGSEYPDDWKRCPTDEAVLLLSKFVGKYEIQSILGTGGMGAVYKAFNPDTKAPVAIKLMHAEASAVEASRARFQREAAAVAALRTRHLVTIYDFGSLDDGTLYLVMEYLEGHNLRPEIQPGGMPIQRINLVMDGALRGLGAAHRKNIVHRDLKPENIFISQTDDGEVAKVLDFGIAQVDSPDKNQSRLTKEGALMGTPAYMGPEQVAGNRGDLGAWTDVYAMGIILYEMLSGDCPFEDESVTAILTKVLIRDFQPLRSVRPDLPKAVLDVVECSMEDHFDNRFVDANAFREAWNAAYKTLDPMVTSAKMPVFRRTRDQRPVDTPPVGSNAPDAMTATQHPDAQSVPPTGTADTYMSPAQGVTPPSSPGTLTPGGIAFDSQAQQKKGGGMWIALLLVLLVGGGIATFVFMTQGDARDDTTNNNNAVAVVTADAGTTTLPGPGPTLDEHGNPATPDAAPASKPVVPADMAKIEGGSHTVQGFKSVDLPSFYIDKTEVTIATYNRALEAQKKADSAVGGDPEMPMNQVTWQEASDACKALQKQLPSEAQWEFAATRHPLDAYGARLRATGPAQVGTHAGDCTPDGVCDLLGNVAEWAEEVWRSKAGAKIDSEYRVVRGGTYAVSPSSRFARPTARARAKAAGRDAEVGFRCVKQID